MFDFGLGELLLVGIVALIVLGPERLPEAARYKALQELVLMSLELN